MQTRLFTFCPYLAVPSNFQSINARLPKKLFTLKFNFSILQGALRESFEEIGLDVQKVEVWGKLKPVFNKSLMCLVTPVVGMLKDVDLMSLKAQCGEVRALFVVTVDELCFNSASTKFKRGLRTSNLLTIDFLTFLYFLS